MSPLLAALLPRILGALAGAGAVASVPSVTTGELASPIPSTVEEAVMQACLAIGGLIIFFVRRNKNNDSK